jgi:hypothetical protein
MVRYLILIAMLTGCASHDSPTWGEQKEAPFGWIQYCLDNPKDIECKP